MKASIVVIVDQWKFGGRTSDRLHPTKRSKTGEGAGILRYSHRVPQKHSEDGGNAGTQDILNAGARKKKEPFLSETDQRGVKKSHSSENTTGEIHRVST